MFLLMCPLRNFLLGALKATVVLIGVWWFFKFGDLLNGSILGGALGGDSDQYLQYAGVITGKLMSNVGGSEVFPPALEARTPGYPLLVACSLLLTNLGLSLAQGIVVVHLMLWLGVGVAFVRTFSAQLPSFVLWLVLLMASGLMRRQAFTLMPEWSAFCLTLLACSLFVRYSAARHNRTLVAMGLISAFAGLIRPDFVLLAPLLCLGVVWVSRDKRAAAIAVVAGIAPLLLWMSFNAFRFGKLTMAPVEGHVYGIASLLGEEPSEFDSEDARQLRAAFERAPEKLDVGDFLTLVTLHPPAVRIVCANLGLVEEARRRLGFSVVRANGAELAMARAYIREYPLRYAMLVCAGTLTLIWMLPLLPLALKGTTEFYLARLFIGIAGLFHVVHVVFVSCVNIMYERYYLPTASVVVCGGFIVLFLSVKPDLLGIFAQFKKSVDNAPRSESRGEP